ncbi:MAG: S-layer homology domain-containing protein, partial [Clostridia bacterium]|nr:S-layer homology domain-containing protein [Clostridia bacterium]
RQEMFTLLYNILKAAKQLPQADSTKALPDFSDAGQLEPWAKEAVTLLAAMGVIEGSGGKLEPAATATRAQMAQLLYKL